MDIVSKREEQVERGYSTYVDSDIIIQMQELKNGCIIKYITRNIKVE